MIHGINSRKARDHWTMLLPDFFSQCAKSKMTTLMYYTQPILKHRNVSTHKTYRNIRKCRMYVKEFIQFSYE